MKIDREVFIFKTNMLLRGEDREAVREELKRQIEDGVVVLDARTEYRLTLYLRGGKKNIAVELVEAAAEQDNRPPCEFCSRFDFGSYSPEVDKYGARIATAGGAYRFPIDKQFTFCPVCGRPVKVRATP